MIYEFEDNNKLVKIHDYVAAFVRGISNLYEIKQYDANITMPSRINEKKDVFTISITMDVNPRIE